MDNGKGISQEKLHELDEKPHYLNSVDESLNLRHGLGLLIVRQILNAHQGEMMVSNIEPYGCKTELFFLSENTKRQKP